jgi:Ni,Fe-hydrogenase I large subunit
MANTNPKQQDAINARAEQAVIEAKAIRISRLRACCAPLAVVGVGIAHSPDLCLSCRTHAAALRWGPK